VQGLVTQTAELRAGPRRTLDIGVDLGNGRRLTGTVAGLTANRVVSVTYSALRAKQRLASWIDLLALSASYPDEHWTAHAVGRSRAGPARALAGPLDHRAATWLAELADLYDRGQREPLPLPPKTAAAYAETARRRLTGDDTDPIEAARREWETDRNSAAAIPGEHEDAAHRQVYGDAAPVSVLTGAPRPGEDWNTEATRLGRYAWRLWQPLLSGAERVGPL
jgi:exodeoxyribonuclease V gamma subunit